MCHPGQRPPTGYALLHTLRPSCSGLAASHTTPAATRLPDPPVRLDATAAPSSTLAVLRQPLKRTAAGRHRFSRVASMGGRLFGRRRRRVWQRKRSTGGKFCGSVIGAGWVDDVPIHAKLRTRAEMTSGKISAYCTRGLQRV